MHQIFEGDIINNQFKRERQTEKIRKYNRILGALLLSLLAILAALKTDFMDGISLSKSNEKVFKEDASSDTDFLNESNTFNALTYDSDSDSEDDTAQNTDSTKDTANESEFQIAQDSELGGVTAKNEQGKEQAKGEQPQGSSNEKFSEMPTEQALEKSEENADAEGPHPGFVYISKALPEAKLDVRYATTHNFTGRVVEGYLSDNISITKEAAKALKKASEELKSKGYGIIIYDAYRPKRAVDSFIKWSQEPENNLTKAEFYPDFQKEQLFKLGYLAKRSAHSRGSTVDLTLFDLNTGEPLDMGSPYDFLGPISNHGTNLINETQTKNRNILKDAMKNAGFKELKTEWWHYELINEPYPDTFFDFVIQ